MWRGTQFTERTRFIMFSRGGIVIIIIITSTHRRNQAKLYDRVERTVDGEYDKYARAIYLSGASLDPGPVIIRVKSDWRKLLN